MRIFVVEDEIDVAAFIKKALVRENYAVDVVHDGLTAEEFIAVESYDLIVLDIMLPGRDGLEILRDMRSQGDGTPVLLLTARGDVSDRVAGLDAGADDYLVKPFAVAELGARVRSLLRRQSMEHSPVLQVGDVILDTSLRRVRVGGQFVELTNREYAILEYLMRNKNRLLSKSMIAEHVWDYHFNSDYNLIEVYIRRIRKKIENHQKIIHTVRNSGYVIREVEE